MDRKVWVTVDNKEKRQVFHLPIFLIVVHVSMAYTYHKTTKLHFKWHEEQKEKKNMCSLEIFQTVYRTDFPFFVCVPVYPNPLPTDKLFLNITKSLNCSEFGSDFSSFLICSSHVILSITLTLNSFHTLPTVKHIKLV